MIKYKINQKLLLYIILQLIVNVDQNIYLNNIIKLEKLKKKNFNLFFIEENTKYNFTHFRFYQFFNLNYLKNIYNINLKEKNINAIKTLPKKLSKNVLFKVRNVSFKQFNVKYFNEVAHLFLVNMWLKNLKNICKYIKKKLDSVHFKQHRLYFLFFFKILNKYIKPNFTDLQLKGVYLIFRGKLGKGGNSRKKVMFFKEGHYSLSNKLLCLNTQKWDVWTRTGTVGCTMRLFYKNYDNFFKFLYNYLFNYYDKIEFYFN